MGSGGVTSTFGALVPGAFDAGALRVSPQANSANAIAQYVYINLFLGDHLQFLKTAG